MVTAQNIKQNHLKQSGLERLTELLQAFQVNNVLSSSIVSRANEEVGLLQNKEALFPLPRVQHGLITQLAHTLKLPRQ